MDDACFRREPLREAVKRLDARLVETKALGTKALEENVRRASRL